MTKDQTLFGKTVFVTGGSGGLGKAISKKLAARGAHITIFSRRAEPLEDAKKDIITSCLDATRQDINAVVLDMADASAVSEAFRYQPRIADMLYCSAGGNHTENGFLLDIQASDLDSCMKNNYYSTVYAAKALLDIWIADDKKSAPDSHSPHKSRKMVFINSAAAFLGLPGSVAYTPAKAAVRALADTLRFEFLRLNTPNVTYTVHIAFPADLISPGFVLEQDTKPALTKRIQGTNVATFAELEKKFPSSEQVAKGVVEAVDNGDFIICKDSMNASFLFTGMMGLSPRRGWGVWDSLVGIVMGCFVMPVLRRRWERLASADRRNDSGM